MHITIVSEFQGQPAPEQHTYASGQLAVLVRERGVETRKKEIEERKGGGGMPKCQDEDVNAYLTEDGSLSVNLYGAAAEPTRSLF